jgi:hypothetical protein
MGLKLGPKRGSRVKVSLGVASPWAPRTKVELSGGPRWNLAQGKPLVNFESGLGLKKRMGLKLGPKRGSRVKVSLGVASILGLRLGLGWPGIRVIPTVPKKPSIFKRRKRDMLWVSQN